MRIIRYLDGDSCIHYGAENPDGTATRIDGDIFGDFRATTEPADVRKVLAPVAPAALLCVGLNYRRHAEETNAKIPEYPVLFMRSDPAPPFPAQRRGRLRMRTRRGDWQGM
jgi:hypothetical protein